MSEEATHGPDGQTGQLDRRERILRDIEGTERRDKHVGGALFTLW